MNILGEMASTYCEGRRATYDDEGTVDKEYWFFEDGSVLVNENHGQFFFTETPRQAMDDISSWEGQQFDPDADDWSWRANLY
jgi:hypothetical protein